MWHAHELLHSTDCRKLMPYSLTFQSCNLSLVTFFAAGYVCGSRVEVVMYMREGGRIEDDSRSVATIPSTEWGAGRSDTKSTAVKWPLLCTLTLGHLFHITQTHSHRKAVIGSPSTSNSLVMSWSGSLSLVRPPSSSLSACTLLLTSYYGNAATSPSES